MELIKYEIIKDSPYIGKKYGKLTIIEERKNPQKCRHNLFLCKCDCGKRHQADKYSVIYGDTISCGCIHNNSTKLCRKKYERKGKRLYSIFKGMKARCYNINDHNYERYGARGITICEEWLNDFNAFKNWALNNGYTKYLSIDRINSNKGYSPDNCRWATSKEQNENKTNNAYFIYKDKVYNSTNLAKVLKVNYNTLRTWYHRHGNLNKYNCINSTYEEYLNQ